MSDEILYQPPPAPDRRLSYGPASQQFGHFYLSPEPRGFALMIHGGFWRNRYDLQHTGHLCAALARAGVSTLNIEYRRTGDPGGGWPGTADDIRQAYQYASALAAEPIVVVGHSAGGHLALWLATQGVPLRATVALAPVSDLPQTYSLGLSNHAVQEFLGATPAEDPARYEAASPRHLPISSVPQRLLHGTEDDQVPVEMSRAYAARPGGDVTLIELPATGHYELIDPTSTAWPAVLAAVVR